MDINVYRQMLSFTPGGLADQFLEQYKYEYGEKKAIEIVRTVENSEKVSFYLNNILRDDMRPSTKGLETLMNTIPYFMFSKEETLCMGGLVCFLMWRNRWMIENNIYDVMERQEIDHQIVSICADFIKNCSINKYNKSNNFFHRFSRRIMSIQ